VADSIESTKGVTVAAKKKKASPKVVQGTCGCGAVQFTVQPPLSDVVWCHCSKCQRFHGGPGAYTTVPRAAMSFTKREGMAWWDASPTVQRGFCKLCGSSLLYSDSNESTVAICAGALISPTGLKSVSHIFVGSKPDWYEVEGKLPKHDED
jgi:hypothetical protein